MLLNFKKFLSTQKIIVDQTFTKLNYGCGHDKKSGYLNVDIDEGCKPDFILKNGDLSLLPKHYYEEVYAKDVLEHIPRNESLKMLLEFSSLLRESGELVIQTSSIIHIAEKIQSNPNFADHYGWTICLFGNQAHIGDFHLTGFTERTLTVHLAAAGFEIVSQKLIDEWMFHYVCKKKYSWDAMLLNCQIGELSDLEFIAEAYKEIFYRELDNQGRVHFSNLLKHGETRRNVLLKIASSPERLYVMARKLGL